MKVGRKIAKAIERDVCDRRGLSHEFEACDEDIQQEIRDEWARIAEEIHQAALDEVLKEAVAIIGQAVKPYPEPWDEIDKALWRVSAQAFLDKYRTRQEGKGE